MFPTSRVNRHLAAAAIFLAAFALRVAALNRIPPGLSHDEAYNGVTALQVLNGGPWPVFFEINKGIEPLIIYLEALAFYGFGVGPVQLRLVNVFCGLLAVALVYPLAARLFNRRVALLAMAGLAVSFWPVFVGRLTLRAITLPPLLLLSLYFLWRGLEPSGNGRRAGRTVFLALSGLSAGAAMYTYLSARFVPLLVISVAGYFLLRKQITRRQGLGLLLWAAIWAVIFLPLAGYYWQHVESFSERAGQVTTLPYLRNGEFGPTIRNTLLTLGMFTFRGDETDRYNLDGRPVFDWANGLLFYLGLALLLRQLAGRNRAKAGPAALLLLWLFWMLLPDFITDDSPHFLRTIGAMPAVYMVWAVGLEHLAWRVPWPAFLTRRGPRPARYRIALPLALLIFTTGHTIFDYFGRWAAADEARYIYGADIAGIARHLKSSAEPGLAAISAEYYRDLDPFRFALHFQGHPPFVIWFDGTQSLAFPPPQSNLSPRYIYSAFAPAPELWKFLLQPEPDTAGQSYRVYRLPPASGLQAGWDALLPENGFTPVTVNNELVLERYRVSGSVVSGGKFQVLLGWQALQPVPPGTDYTFLVQLLDRQGQVWSQADGNGFPPANWQPGVRGAQLLILRLPGDLPPRLYRLTAQVVNRQTGRPLPTNGDSPVILLTSIPGRLAQTPRQMDPARLPNPQPDGAALARGLALRGYRVVPAAVAPGDALAVTLHWQVLQSPDRNYRWQFLLARGPDGNPDAPVYRWSPVEPIGGEWPATQWPAGYWVQDKVQLPVGPEIPAGDFMLWLVPVGEQAEPVGAGGHALGMVHINPTP